VNIRKWLNLRNLQVLDADRQADTLASNRHDKE
jgi:hypothetical protein